MGKLTVKDQATQRKLIPARTYTAIVMAIIDLGTQESEKYGADHKISMGFELHTKKGPALDDTGRQLIAWRDFTLKFSKIVGRTPAALRVALESLLNREFSEDEARAGYDLEQLVGLPCKVQIKHETSNGKTNDQIASILSLDEDDDKPTAAADHIYYELDLTAPIPASIPPWIAKKIQKSREWQSSPGAKSTQRDPGDDDDIPY